MLYFSAQHSKHLVTAGIVHDDIFKFVIPNVDAILASRAEQRCRLGEIQSIVLGGVFVCFKFMPCQLTRTR
jgi:hypothetical protein